LTYTPTEYQWVKGGAKFRIIYPPGQNTDLASSPVFGRLLGFKKEDKRWWKGSKLHDFLCYHIRYNNGVLPEGTYQFWNPLDWKWENCHSYRWRQKEADELFLKINLEEGFPPGKAEWAYRMIRMFGWAHRLLT
jgi:hypothetical protein